MVTDSFKIKNTLDYEDGSVHTAWIIIGPDHAISVDAWGGGKMATFMTGVNIHYFEPQDGYSECDKCDYSPTGKCYASGSSLATEGISARDDDAIWELAQRWYERG